MFNVPAILKPNKLMLNNNFVKEEMVKISLQQEGAERIQSLNSQALRPHKFNGLNKDTLVSGTIIRHQHWHLENKQTQRMGFNFIGVSFAVHLPALSS
jgi:hypothetical protein